MATATAAPLAEPVDWALARRLGRVVGGSEPLGDSYLADSLRDDFAALTHDAESLVVEHTGLHTPGPATAAVLERGEWVDANIESMRTLLAPVLDRLASRMARNPIAPIGRFAAATEMGVLLGYLSQRVLGQYDLLVPDSCEGGDAVYFVGANVLHLEKRFGFRPRDFRLWIALHELTHRAQFTGVPWLRSYFLSSVHELVGRGDLDPRRILGALLRAADDVRRGRTALDGGIIDLVASPEQRRMLERIQALMALLEGHGNAVMNTLGATHVRGQRRMARVLEARRRAGGFAGFVQRLLGLDLKMRQYRLGEAFVTAVEREAGAGALSIAWSGPESLPTLEELERPRTWLARVDPGFTSEGAR